MSSETPAVPNFNPKLYGIVPVVAAIIVVGFWLVTRFTAIDYARDMQTWQEKLNLISESRAADINQWVGEHFKDLRTLAANPSLQLYLTELQTLPQGKAAEPGSEPAQKSYLRNLLVFTAERTGFSPSSSGVATIPANAQEESKSGMAVIDNSNGIIVSTLMQPATRDKIIAHAKELPAGQEAMIDINKYEDGTVYIGFIVPIFSIQGEHNAASQVGRIVGIKTIDSNLYDLLKHPGTTEKTLEAILLRSNNGHIDYLSPLLDGTKPLSKQITHEPRLAESVLIQAPGSFTSDLKDYRGKIVLATSRQIANTAWVLVEKIDRMEALSDSEQRRSDMVLVFFLVIAVIVLVIVAIWWHAHSQRAMMMSHHFRKLATHAMEQERLLRLVADNQPEPIYILDNRLTYQFANQKAVEMARMSPDAVIGKSLKDVRGTATAQQIRERCEKALNSGQVIYDVQYIKDEGAEKIIRSAFVPLDHIPVATLPVDMRGVLVVEQDISQVIHEREQRMATLHQLVHMLVRLVDKRDPFAANHSVLVAELSSELGNDMELDNVTIDTARNAGSLMNIGKILVPTELLTKTGKLTDKEKTIIRDSMAEAAELVKNISFDGPVSETLRQWQERWDGTGYLGLKGEEIIVPARIIAVANAYVGMISPRSWRDAMTSETANSFILEHAEKEFDRRVAIALVHFTETHNGRAWLKKVHDSQKKVA